MPEFEQNQTPRDNPQTIEELALMIESGEGKLTGEDFRRLSKEEETPENLKSIIDLAGRLIDEREKWGIDRLTGLLNCTRIDSALKGAFEWLKKNPQESLTLIFSDLDYLKKANSTEEGHSGGDKLIGAYAEVLKEIYGPKTDMIGRWFLGDEFMVVMRGDRRTVEELNGGLSERLKSLKLKIGGRNFNVSATLAVKKLDPEKDLRAQIKEVSQELIKIKNERDEKRR